MKDFASLSKDFISNFHKWKTSKIYAKTYRSMVKIKQKLQKHESSLASTQTYSALKLQ
jgi:hypothetical protein